MSARRVTRRALIALAVVVGLLAALAVVTTGVDTQRLAFLREGSIPKWTEPCWRKDRYTLPCARVHGRVVLRQLDDPDGDGDRHVVVVAGLGLTTLKIPAGTQAKIPGYGSRVTAIGRWEKDSGQLGSDVVVIGQLHSP